MSIHTNGTSLIVQPKDHIQPSAKYYTTGEQGIYVVCNYMSLQDVGLCSTACSSRTKTWS